MKIPFNVPAYTGKEIDYIKQAIANKQLSGDGFFTKKCSAWFKEKLNCREALLTTSCTSALDMCALLIDIKPGDEVIMPSYTFVSTANAFALRGAKIVFVDIRPDTMNLDEKLIEKAITKKTKAIVVVHYAGVACEMTSVKKIAKKHRLFLIEDAAQAVTSTYKNKFLGAIGDLGCYSFHETKNFSCGEGGALVINNKKFIERAEIIREKGTNRSRFFRGQVDKYTWVDLGSSYLPSELNAAYLFAQLEASKKITAKRKKIWEYYFQKLEPLANQGLISLPFIPKNCGQNYHLFYFKAKDLGERTALLSHFKKQGILAVFHYVPLHSAEAGLKYGRFSGKDVCTTKESERLIRLPLYFGLSFDKLRAIVKTVFNFYQETK